MRVDRCVCFNVSFERVREVALVCNGDLMQVHRATGCGARCGLCIPYIRVVIQTGQVSLPVMTADDFRRMGIPPASVARAESRTA